MVRPHTHDGSQLNMTQRRVDTSCDRVQPQRADTMTCSCPIDPDVVLADGHRVLGEHRHRFPTDRRDVVLVRRGDEVADRASIAVVDPLQPRRRFYFASGFHTSNIQSFEERPGTLIPDIG
jgi:hypothetical protein